VSSGHDPFIADQRASAERAAFDEQGAHPRELVGGGLDSADDFRGLDAAGVAEVLGHGGARDGRRRLLGRRADFGPSLTQRLEARTVLGVTVRRSGQGLSRPSTISPVSIRLFLNEGLIVFNDGSIVFLFVFYLRHGEQGDADDDFHDGVSSVKRL